jgi:hypothetical protein
MSEGNFRERISFSLKLGSSHYTHFILGRNPSAEKDVSSFRALATGLPAA